MLSTAGGLTDRTPQVPAPDDVLASTVEPVAMPTTLPTLASAIRTLKPLPDSAVELVMLAVFDDKPIWFHDRARIDGVHVPSQVLGTDG